MRRTAFSLALAAEMFVITGLAAAQVTAPSQPPATPAPSPDVDRKIDPAERERMQKEWNDLKKEWESLTPEARLLSIIHTKNLKEIELGRLGQQRASSAGVKEYAAMMVKDHTEADSKLNTLATAEKITLWDTEKTHKVLKYKKMYGKDKDADKKTDKDRTPGAHPDDRKPGAPVDKPRRDDDHAGKRDDSHGRYDGMKDPTEKLQSLTGEEFDAAFGRIMHKGHGELLTMLEKHQSELTNTQVKSYVSEVTATVRRHHEQAASLPGAKDDSSKPRDPSKPKDKDKDHGNKNDPKRDR